MTHNTYKQTHKQKAVSTALSSRATNHEKEAAEYETGKNSTAMEAVEYETGKNSTEENYRATNMA